VQSWLRGVSKSVNRVVTLSKNILSNPRHLFLFTLCEALFTVGYLNFGLLMTVALVAALADSAISILDTTTRFSILFFSISLGCELLIIAGGKLKEARGVQR
jgi:hypothetical protein